MRLGPFTLTRTKAAGDQLITQWPLTPSAGWWPVIREGFAGAWQRGMTVSIQDANAHPTFWACITLIAGDVAKCRPRLMTEDSDGILTESGQSPYWAPIQKPNHYQNRIQFFSYWIICKLTRGNAYALKERDARGVVTALYLLDPTRVRPLVTPLGDVYYALGQDVLSGVTSTDTVVPAREIIHDSMNCLYHPLVGLSPVYACGHAAIQALTIVDNATRLFKRGSMIGGMLVAPGQISTETAKRLEDYWQANYAGEANVGKVAVLGDGLKFENQTVMSAVDAQLIDQLKWDDEKICATLHVPPYMVGVGPLPSYNNVDALGQQYYGQALQILFESLELCLTEGIEIKGAMEVEFDLEGLDRMDAVQRMETATKGVTGGILKPNEARAKFNLGPVPGGDTPYLQQQNYGLEALAKRDAAEINPPPVPVPAPVPTPALPPAKALDVDWDELGAIIVRSLEVAA